VVEDERNMAEAIARGLRREGMAVDVAYDGSTGHEMAFVTRYDVVVLDRDLPGGTGDEICADLGSPGALTRALMLTAGVNVARRARGGGRGRDHLPDQAVRVRRAVGRGRGTGPAPPPGRPAHPPRR